MKYIDAEKLIAEIEKRIKSAESYPFIEAEFGAEVRREGKIQTYNEILSLITSLQQERGPHTESWIEDTKKELQHEEELLEMRLDTLKRIREKKNQFKQEQPEVDFEKELDRIWFDNKLGDYFDNDALDYAHIRTLCKHFYELGLNARKEE